MDQYKKYGKYAIIPIIWYTLGRFDRDNVRKNMYNKGYNVSQSMKKIPMWDDYAEPFMINQFSVLFTAGHSFLEGMISDNDNKVRIDDDMKQFDKEIKDELSKK